MSKFINDSLAEQIERGEVWTAGTTFTIQNGTPIEFIPSVGAKKTSLIVEVLTGGYLQVLLYEGVSSSSGTLTEENLERNGSYSKDFSTQFGSFTGGSLVLSRSLPTGSAGDPINLSPEAPLIMKINTKYGIQIKNKGTDPAETQVALFYREID